MVFYHHKIPSKVFDTQRSTLLVIFINLYMTISNTFLISICKISLIDKNHYIIDSSMTKQVCKRIRAKFSVCIEKEKFDSIQTQANRIKRFYTIRMHIRQTKFKKTQNVNLKLPKRIFICITGQCIVMFPRSSYYSDFSLVILYYHLILLTYELHIFSIS